MAVLLGTGSTRSNTNPKLQAIGREGYESSRVAVWKLGSSQAALDYTDATTFDTFEDANLTIKAGSWLRRLELDTSMKKSGSATPKIQLQSRDYDEKTETWSDWSAKYTDAEGNETTRPERTLAAADSLYRLGVPQEFGEPLTKDTQYRIAVTADSEDGDVQSTTSVLFVDFVNI